MYWLTVHYIHTSNYSMYELLYVRFFLLFFPTLCNAQYVHSKVQFISVAQCCHGVQITHQFGSHDGAQLEGCGHLLLQGDTTQR